MDLPPYRVEGAGRPLLYLPGLDGTGELFYRQLPQLVGTYRVITTAYRKGSAVRFEELVEDVRTLVTAETQREPITLCAESFGGALGLAYAVRNAASVRCLVLANTFARLAGRRRALMAAAALDVLPRCVESIGRRLGARLLLLNSVEEPDRQVFFQTVAGDGSNYGNRLRMLARLDLRAALHSITCPVLLIAGTADRVINAVEHARMMASLLPRARVFVMAGVGHLAFMNPHVNVAAILAGDSAGEL